MKTIKAMSLRVMAVAALAIVFVLPAKAQLSDKGYGNIDWQFNVPLSNGFADDASGWGMNFEGGYFVTDNIGLGLFFNYHTNNEYVGRTTLTDSNSALNTDQQHSIYEIPFGVDARYQFNRGGTFQPYFAAKVGTNFAKMTSQYNIFQNREKTWGFFVQPEVGLHIFPWAYGPGLHLALYYSYATNKADILTYHVDGLNNFGFRVGLAF